LHDRNIGHVDDFLPSLTDIAADGQLNMTTYLSKKVGRVLFPHLPHEKRKQKLFKIVLVLVASLCITALLVVRMVHGIKQFKQPDISVVSNP